MIGARFLANGVALFALLLTCACGQQPTDGNAGAAVNAAASAESTIPEDCARPEIMVAESGARLTPDMIVKTKANFATAFDRSCVNGTLESGEFYDPEAVDVGRLFLFNAPDANVASIYTSEANGNRMVLEFPFLTADGQSRVPTDEELEEAIYCNVVGATPKEEEESGRCLPD